MRCRVNVDGVVFGVRRLAQVMERGSIVVTASLAGLTGMPSDAIYSLTKHAVVGFVRSVAPQLEPVTINAVCPGIADTPMIDAQRAAFAAAGFPLLAPRGRSPTPSGAPRRAARAGEAGSCSRARALHRSASRRCPARAARATASGCRPLLVEAGVEGHVLHQRERAARPLHGLAPEVVGVVDERVVDLRGRRRSTTARRARPRAGRRPSPRSRRTDAAAGSRARRARRRRGMKPTWSKIGAAASSTSANSASTMNACGCTGPPTKTGRRRPAAPRATAPPPTAGTSEGLLSTRPIAPSSSWWAIRTTVLRKFGSTQRRRRDEELSLQRLHVNESPTRRRLQTSSGSVGRRPCGAPRPGRRRSGRARAVISMCAERRLVGQAAGAVHLDRAVDHVLQRLRGEELDRRDLDARLVAAVDLVRGVERHQPAGLDLDVAVGDPVLHRLLARRAARRTPRARARTSTSASNARCIWPSQRITWWMRPGPSRFCAIRKPAPSSPSVFADRARGRSCSAPRSASTSRVPAWPSTGIGRTTSTPGVSAGTMICVARACGGASGSVTAITIPKAAPSAPDENHLWPSITQSSPSRTRACAAWSGRSPAPRARSSRRTSGSRRRRAGAASAPSASSVPNRWRISALPASGAWQPKTSCPQSERPMCSFRYA